MPLTAESATYLHLLQNLSLISISIIFTPLLTLIACISQLISPVTTTSRHISQSRRRRLTSSSGTQRPRVVLVTGVGMSKGLTIARAFYRAGHTVIGADFEPYGVRVCGRLSKALTKFYTLTRPVDGDAEPYVESLIEIVKRERVELWVSCSGVASAMEDAEAAESVERLTSCKTIQFGAELTKVLHEKHSFIMKTQELGLNVPETHLITSVEEGVERLSQAARGKRFILKSVGLDDSIRADMSLLPKSEEADTRKYLTRMRPSPSRPFVLQQFIKGPEYCTHSIVVRGKVVAFTSCPSSELLMHYRSLQSSSELYQAMLRYTQTFAEKVGERMTGHFSIDFLLDETRTGVDIMTRIFPIECNPRAHTAVVLMAHQSERMAEAYLRLLDGEEESSNDVAFPASPYSFYWTGHDLIEFVALPVLSLLTLNVTPRELLASWLEFVNHVLYWKDGTHEIWDPWPAWWLYCGYWPGMFLATIWHGNWWSRCNVSTTKLFRCRG